MKGRMDCHGESHIGLVRETNEDQFLIADLKKSVIIHHTSLSYEDETELLGGSRAKLMLVADGVGGNAAGERASRLALDSVIQYLLNAMHWMFRPKDDHDAGFVDDLKSALSFTQQRIQQAAANAPSDDGMATTITMAYVVWPYVYLVYAGDSRAYLYRDGTLTLLTHDQTFAQELADAGVLKPEEISASPMNHVLSSLLGCDPSQLDPQVYKAELAMNDTLLLCTDGLTRHLDEPRIAAILTSNEPASAICHRLIDSANDAGGSDNTTVIVARFTDRATSPVIHESVHASSDVDDTMKEPVY